jgi:arginyl-tRNA synthetase
MTEPILNPWDQFRQQVVQALLEASGKDLSGFLESPANPEHGDLGCTAAFSMAKEQRRNPAEIAKELAKIDASQFPLIKAVVAQGPYVNFFINIEPYGQLVFETLQRFGDKYGKSIKFQGIHAVVEFPAVNPNNPWHIGHARNAVLGDTMARVLEMVGYDVTRMDYINDLGLQIAVVYWGLKHLTKAPLKGKYDQALGRVYVEAHKQHDKAQVEQYLQLMEKGDNEVAQEVRAMSRQCLRAHHKTAAKLNVQHDLLVWESDIAHSGLFAEALEKILESPNVKRLSDGEKAGCLIVDLSAYEEFRQLKDTEKILIRSNGVATYVAKDVAFHFWKFGFIKDPFKYRHFRRKREEKEPLWTTDQKGEPGLFKPADVIFNVIGMPQSFPQRTVYLVLKTLGYEKASANYYHLAYEFVTLPDKRFSGRQGTWIGYSTDAVVREATRRARREVKSRNPKESAKFYRQVAEAIGAAAVRYSLLKVAVEKQITFRWEEMLNFDGNAAPYLMYTHARASSILRKQAAPKEANLDVLDTSHEVELVKLIGRFPDVVLGIVEGMQREKWGTRIELFKLTEYTYQLAVAFNSFYNHCPVLKAKSADLVAARLLLVSACRQVLWNALSLLGIHPLERI